MYIWYTHMHIQTTYRQIYTDIYTDIYSIYTGIYDTDIYGPIHKHIRIYTQMENIPFATVSGKMPLLRRHILFADVSTHTQNTQKKERKITKRMDMGYGVSNP